VIRDNHKRHWREYEIDDNAKGLQPNSYKAVCRKWFRIVLFRAAKLPDSKCFNFRNKLLCTFKEKSNASKPRISCGLGWELPLTFYLAISCAQSLSNGKTKAHTRCKWMQSRPDTSTIARIESGLRSDIVPRMPRTPLGSIGISACNIIGRFYS